MDDCFIYSSKDIGKIPEVNSGFLPSWVNQEKELFSIRKKDGFFSCCDILKLQNRRVPLLYKKAVEEKGIYEVEITFESVNLEEEVLIFTSRRHLAFKEKVSNLTTLSFLIDVSPIIPRGQEVAVNEYAINLAFFNTKVKNIKVTKSEGRRIFIFGDSTVADQGAELPYSPFTSYSGWGQMLSYFITKNAISNHAHSGLTTASFRREGHYKIVIKEIRENDIVLMQFGHNDQKLKELNYNTGYRENLIKYIEEIEEKGAIAIIVTPLARNSFDNCGNYNDLLKEFASECLLIGKEKNIQVIDLHKFSMELFISLGLEESKKYFFPSDFTHTNDYGAFIFAQFIASQLKLDKKNLADTWPVLKTSFLEIPKESHLPPELDNQIELKKLLNDNSYLKRYELFHYLIYTIRLFPTAVYLDHYIDVIGHETFVPDVETAYENNLIPSSFIEDNKLKPYQEVRAEEFLTVVRLGYQIRRNIKDKTNEELGLLMPDVKANSFITKSQAAQILLKVKL